MKAVIAALLLSASAPSRPPLVPSPELFPEPIEEPTSIHGTWWFWPMLSVATVQTAATLGVLALILPLFLNPPRPGGSL